jgi:REP element-mobilizing transposase RayT
MTSDKECGVPRLPRLCLPGIPVHVIQRGNNRQATFASNDDFAAYAHWLLEYPLNIRWQFTPGYS